MYYIGAIWHILPYLINHLYLLLKSPILKPEPNINVEGGVAVFRAPPSFAVRSSIDGAAQAERPWRASFGLDFAIVRLTQIWPSHI
jgi:hypothetical protein